jgi:hypothetical protein
LKIQATESRTFLAATLYATVQATLPPIGGLLISALVHLTFTLVFLAVIASRDNLRTVMISVAVYAAVLGIAVALPFKFMDRKVNMRGTEVVLSDIPELLEANNIRVRSYPEVLPAARVALPSSSPSLRALRLVLREEHGFDLRQLPVCANAVSVSFLWGMRSGGGLLLDSLGTRHELAPATRAREASRSVTPFGSAQ